MEGLQRCSPTLRMCEWKCGVSEGYFAAWQRNTHMQVHCMNIHRCVFRLFELSEQTVAYSPLFSWDFMFYVHIYTNALSDITVVYRHVRIAAIVCIQFHEHKP